MSFRVSTIKYRYSRLHRQDQYTCYTLFLDDLIGVTAGARLGTSAYTRYVLSS